MYFGFSEVFPYGQQTRRAYSTYVVSTPSLRDFEERYAGHWESFREYAEDLADEVGLMQGWPEEAMRYFDWSSWTADLAHDYTVVDAPPPEYGVFVFRNL